MKSNIIKSVFAAVLVLATVSTSHAYTKFGSGGYTSNYTDFSISTPSGGVYSGTILYY